MIYSVFADSLCCTKSNQIDQSLAIFFQSSTVCIIPRSSFFRQDRSKNRFSFYINKCQFIPILVSYPRLHSLLIAMHCVNVVFPYVHIFMKQ